MLSNSEVFDFLQNNNYDIRITHNARWIDQKCTADVLTIIADCICYFLLKNPTKTEFTTADIWFSDYAQENVTAIFKKPDVTSPKAQNEYDKFFQQPMELFAAAGILNKYKKGNRNIYSTSNKELLEYIALREKNALFFLNAYITKTLKDSEIYYLFETFFESTTTINFNKLKKGFSAFTIKYTKINGITECNRIFTKVLNPLAYYKNSLGAVKGYCSKNNITYDLLMYNRDNFRDIYSEKPKGITRKEYMSQNNINPNSALTKYQTQKAKHYMHLYNDQYRDGQSEHTDDLAVGKALHAHHIFPEHEFEEISYYLENIIMLTPSQHLEKAHPNNRTKDIDEMYQHCLLLSKVERIEENLTNHDNIDKIYDFSNLLYVLNIGFNDEKLLDIVDMDFCNVVNAINLHYVA